MGKDITGALNTCNAAEMERQDSGFGESSTRAKNTNSQEESKVEPSDLQDLVSVGVALTSSGRSLKRPQTSSRPSSINANSRQGSISYSGRSSFIINNPATGHSRRPRLTSNNFSSAYDRPNTEDPFVVHRRSIQVFPPGKSSTEIQSPTRIEPLRRFTTPNPPKSPHKSISTTKDNDSLESHSLPRYTNYVPAANTDWTLPSTRLREYRKIDQSCQGIRGLWRRFAPHWCHNNSRLSFFDEDKDDTCSVRRYRIDLSKGQPDLQRSSVNVKEEAAQPTKSKMRRNWSNFTSNNKATN